MAKRGPSRRSGTGNGRSGDAGNRSGGISPSGTAVNRPAGPRPSAPNDDDAVSLPGRDRAASDLTGAARADSAAGSRLPTDERARDRLRQRRPTARRGNHGRAAARQAHANAAARNRTAGDRGRANGNSRGRHARSSSTNAAIFGSIFVVLAVVIIIVIATLGGSSPTSKGGQIATVPASASLVNSVTKVPASAFAAAGKNSPDVSDQGALVALPSSAPHPTIGGKPEIAYMGAEYCPYCAAFRWPFAIALSRFGTFTGLKQTASGSHDAYPNTHTLSFYGAKYSSPYISLSTTEFETNICTDVVSGVCAAYKPLQTPSKANNTLFDTYDTKKYFPAAAQASSANQGWIPFVYWGGKYVESGGFYRPQQLTRFTYADVEQALKHPAIAGGLGQSILQAANIYTALICQVDGGKRASVCNSAPVQAAMKLLPSLPRHE